MGAKPNPMKSLMMLPMIFLMNKVDFENPMILNGARAAFFAAQIMSLILGYYLKTTIEKKNDTRKIFVPKAASPFEQQPNYEDMTETTYVEYETGKAKEFLKQTVIGTLISSFIHFKVGVNQVVLIQAVMIPMNLFDNPLVRAYVLGKKDGRLWDEKLEGESIDVPATTEGEDKKSKGRKASEDIQEVDVHELSPEDAIAATWDAGMAGDFYSLEVALKKNPNARTKEDGWTALMVACGTPIDTEAFIAKLIGDGCDICATDNDGWTALHWSAFHGRPESAEALLRNCPADELEALLKIHDNENRTAKDLAESEGNTDVAEIIEQYMSRTSEIDPTDRNSESVDSTLRQRKTASKEDHSNSEINEVD